MYRRAYPESTGGKGTRPFGKGVSGTGTDSIGGVIGKGGKGGDKGGGKGGGKGSASKGSFGALPKGLQNKAKFSKKGSGGKTVGGKKSTSAAPKTCFFYGGKKNKGSSAEMDDNFLRWLFPDVVDKIKKNEKEEEEEEEESRIPEVELKKLKELVVDKVNFHIKGKKKEGDAPDQAKKRGNAVKHRTEKYRCCACKPKEKCTCEGKTKIPVLRRGQEFKVTVIFNRPYNVEQDDLILIVDPDTENTGKNMAVNFKLNEERTEPFTEGKTWTARIVKKLPEKNALKLAVWIPGNCVIGEWELRVKTSLNGEVKKLIYRHPKKFVVLFNPWSAQDQFHYTDDQADLKEYILNDKGTAYFGCGTYPQCKPWTYGQFENGILQVSLSLLKKAFGFKMTSAMGDPIRVSRALSRIVNSCGDDGVLTGNWSGEYEGGVNPCKWATSTAILHQHAEEGAPVLYGQCWVFSHVLTAVCRALGIPCRSVTNFDSAHDTDGTCTIDCYFNEEGDDLKGMKTDSIWNFHVWNEVWMQRPDIEGRDCHGWHVIDATPQEKSDGFYQCGPCPVKAVKNGWIDIGFDTAFIFAEVNADEVHWVIDADGQKTMSALKKKKVGNRISTKPADGAPHKGNIFSWNKDNPEHRFDLTCFYKYKEGTDEERQAVQRAVRLTGSGEGVYTESQDIEVDFEEAPGKMVGEDFEVTVLVKNVSKEDKEVDTLLSARSASYWNDSDKDKEIKKEKPGKKMIKAGAQERFKINVPCSLYSKECDESMNIFIYARVKDLKMNMPYSAQQPFKLGMPDIEMSYPEESEEKQVVTVELKVTNPLDSPLTEVMLTMKGDLTQSEDDPNVFESFFWENYLDHRDLKPKETVTIALQLYWEDPKEEEDSDEEDDDGEEDGDGAADHHGEEKEKCKFQSFEFACRELYPMTGTCTIKCRSKNQ